MDNFPFALRWLLKAEGGYVNNPADKGGATFAGVTAQTYASWRLSQKLPNRPIRDITPEEIEAIYRSRYWTTAKCDQMPGKLACTHFDGSVNIGPGNAARLLQRALGIGEDGNIGPATLAAIAKYEEMSLVDALLACRQDYYEDIVDRNPGQSVFLKGWENRLNNLREYVS